MGSVSSHAINFVLRSDLKYDPVEDFAPLALLAGVPNAMVVSAGLPVESAEEFVAYAKERPGELNFGSVGMGTSQHLGGELLKMRTGIDMLHVPYNNNALLLGDLANGKIHVVFDNLPNVLGQVQAGTLKALGVTTAERSPQVPDLPTLTEEGIADFNISSWVALFAPAGLPEDIQQRLSEEIVAVVAMPEVQEKLRNAGTLPLQGGAAELRAFVEGEIARWTEVVGTAGMAK